MSNNTPMVNELMNAITIAANGVVRVPSEGIDLAKMHPSGFFSIEIQLSGDGTGKFEYELSNDPDASAITWITPSSASDIVTAHVKTSGPGGDGTDIYAFTPEVARRLRIKITETGGANSITVTARLVIQ